MTWWIICLIIVVLVLATWLIVVVDEVVGYHKPSVDPAERVAEARASVRLAEIALGQQTNSLNWRLRHDLDELRTAAIRDMQHVDQQSRRS